MGIWFWFVCLFSRQDLTMYPWLACNSQRSPGLCVQHCILSRKFHFASENTLVCQCRCQDCKAMVHIPISKWWAASWGSCKNPRGLCKSFSANPHFLTECQTGSTLQAAFMLSSFTSTCFPRLVSFNLLQIKMNPNLVLHLSSLCR